jgi:hypothetical protein
MNFSKRYRNLKSQILRELFDLQTSKDKTKVKMYDNTWTPFEQVHFAHLPGRVTEVPEEMKRRKDHPNGSERYCISDLMEACVHGVISKNLVFKEANKTFPISNRIHKSIDCKKNKNEIINRITKEPGPDGKKWSKKRAQKVFEVLTPIFDLK